MKEDLNFSSEIIKNRTKTLLKYINQYTSFLTKQQYTSLIQILPTEAKRTKEEQKQAQKWLKAFKAPSEDWYEQEIRRILRSFLNYLNLNKGTDRYFTVTTGSKAVMTATVNFLIVLGFEGMFKQYTTERYNRRYRERCCSYYCGHKQNTISYHLEFLHRFKGKDDVTVVKRIWTDIKNNVDPDSFRLICSYGNWSENRFDWYKFKRHPDFDFLQTKDKETEVESKKQEISQTNNLSNSSPNDDSENNEFVVIVIEAGNNSKSSIRKLLLSLDVKFLTEE